VRLPIVLLLLAVAAPAAAQQRGCTEPSHREFDFWVGDWTVTDSAGATVYGTNRITNEESGCLIHEHWIGSKGGSGQSLNYFDLNTRKWVQVWVDSGAGTLRLEGNLENGKMVLLGVAPGPNGTTVQHRAIWSKEPDGRVRQYWKSSSDGGKTWQFVIDGWYRLKTG
jgi:hypothetical protein